MKKKKKKKENRITGQEEGAQEAEGVKRERERW